MVPAPVRGALVALALSFALLAPSAEAAAPTWFSFAPYTDVSGFPAPELGDFRTEAGVRHVSLGFVVSADPVGAPPATCDPTWGGYPEYPAEDPADPVLTPYRAADIAAHKAAGGDVVVSFGGQTGTELAITCTTVPLLKAAYKKAIDAYLVDHIDLDIEGAIVPDTAANTRRAQAIKQLQDEFAAAGKTLRVSYTVAVLPSGLLDEDVALLTNAVQNGVRLDLVNIMAMNYGAGEAPNPDGRLDEYAAQAAISTRNQLRTILTGLTDAEIMRRVGVTPMIGINNTSTERFSVQEAIDFTGWAQDNEIGMIGAWSLGRDSQCPTPQATTSEDCSGVDQTKWAFSRAFGAFDNTKGPRVIPIGTPAGNDPVPGPATGGTAASGSTTPSATTPPVSGPAPGRRLTAAETRSWLAKVLRLLRPLKSARRARTVTLPAFGPGTLRVELLRGRRSLATHTLRTRASGTTRLRLRRLRSLAKEARLRFTPQLGPVVTVKRRL